MIKPKIVRSGKGGIGNIKYIKQEEAKTILQKLSCKRILKEFMLQSANEQCY